MFGVNFVFINLFAIYTIITIMAAVRYYTEPRAALLLAFRRICRNAVCCMALTLICYISGPSVLRVVAMVVVLLLTMYKAVKYLSFSYSITAALGLIANAMDIDEQYMIIEDFHTRALRFMDEEFQELFHREALYFMVRD